ncbi:hypothetical protein REPUB_Repub03eG0143500 [Reevesia pubescens]
MAQVLAETAYSGDLWRKVLLSASTNERLEEVLTSLWMIWSNRNECLYQGSCSTLRKLRETVRRKTEAYITANAVNTDGSNRVEGKGAQGGSWTPPDQKSIKLNVDAFFNNQSHEAGLRVVARDKLAREQRLNRVTIESDCLVAIHEIQKGAQYKIAHELAKLETQVGGSSFLWRALPPQIYNMDMFSI